MEWVSCLPCTNSAYVCIPVRVRLNLKVLLMGLMPYEVVNLSSYFVQILYNNDDDGSALILNEYMERRCVTLVLDKQWVCLCACALEFEGFIGDQFSLRSQFYPHVLFKYTAMVMTALHRS